ncbi:MAG: HAMP domain-containing protein [Nitrospinota bacterium]|nr:HAMP domain-containing protein [Nitrospinota bacterium]
MKMEKINQNDPRFNRIIDLIMNLAEGDLESRAEVSNKGDELDAIITGLNMLAEELKAKQETEK